MLSPTSKAAVLPVFPPTLGEATRTGWAIAGAVLKAIINAIEPIEFIAFISD
jgi:hypothetical protein